MQPVVAGDVFAVHEVSIGIVQGHYRAPSRRVVEQQSPDLRYLINAIPIPETRAICGSPSDTIVRKIRSAREVPGEPADIIAAGQDPHRLRDCRDYVITAMRHEDTALTRTLQYSHSVPQFKGGAASNRNAGSGSEEIPNASD